MKKNESISKLSVQVKPDAKRYSADLIEARRELREAQAMLSEARLSYEWARNLGDDWEGYWQDLEYTSQYVREKQANLKALMEA